MKKTKTKPDVNLRHFFHEVKNHKVRKAMWISMLVLAIVESSFLFIQAAQGFTTKSAEDVSLASMIVLLFANVMWMIYGAFIIGDLPLFVSGLLYIIGGTLVLITIIIYPGNEQRQQRIANLL